MTFESIFTFITSEFGVVAVLLLIIFALLQGKVVTKQQADELKAANKTLLDNHTKISDSLEVISKTTEDSLEESRTILKLITSAREVSRVDRNSDEIST